MPRESIHHIDEARTKIIEVLQSGWDDFRADKVLIIEDAFGRITFGVWGEEPNDDSFRAQLEAIKPFGSGSYYRCPTTAGNFDPLELATSWDEAGSIDESGDWDNRIRLIVRHRMLPAWQRTVAQPILRELGARDCPVVAFYSFKGGMGRSTALALFALERLRQNEHVVVIDLDIDAPGLGTILPIDMTPPYGVVDYLIELPVLGKHPEDLRDYYYALDLPKVRSTGSLKIFPAGRLDEHYLGKMARLDFEHSEIEGGLKHPLEELVSHIYEELHPDLILIDSRTGFSETAGMLLSGICDYHVLFGVQSDQSWQGLGYAIRKLGVDRIHRGLPQAEFMLVQAMIPEAKEPREIALQGFAEKAKDLCEVLYYLEPDPERDENLWYVDDAGGEDSPDIAVSLLYRIAFSQTVTIDDLLDSLDSSKEIQNYCETLARRVERILPGREA